MNTKHYSITLAFIVEAHTPEQAKEYGRIALDEIRKRLTILAYQPANITEWPE